MKSFAVLTLSLAPFAAFAVACNSDPDSATGGGGGGTAAQVTFHKDVEPLLQKSCLSCHYPGRIGGFSLEKYEDAAALAGAMAAATEERRMPPWSARTTDECQPRFGFVGDISLSDDEIALLRAWADAGAPEGDPKDAPATYVPPPDGLPNKDLEITPSAPSVVDGDSDQFVCVVYDPQLTEEKWIDGIHFMPGNTKVAHHALTFRVDRTKAMELSGGAERFDCFGGAPGDIVHVWAPGGNPFELPDDVGIRLKPDQVIVVQMHYHPTGQGPEEDTSALQLRYAPAKPGYQFVVTFPGNAKDASEGLLPDPDDRTSEPEFRIPAGAKDHVETMEVVVPPEVIIDVPILMAMTHMHYVGTDIKLEIDRKNLSASQPDKECLIHTPVWDFNWQRMYTYDTDILTLPTGKAGDVLRLTCHYNNSLDNPYVKKALEQQGLSEPQDVVLGEQTLNEMCLVPLGLLLPSAIDI